MKLSASTDSPIKGHEHRPGVRTIMELFDIGPVIAITTLAACVVLVTCATFYFFRSAPPSSITISTGPEGSNYQKNAAKYQKVLEQNGIKLKIVTSEGSLQNLERLLDPKSEVSVALVQGGISYPGTENLVSLGSVSYQPLMLFYRGKPFELIGDLAKKRVAVGPVGSGTRKFALAILGANGIKEDGKTALFDWDGEEAAKALSDGKLDAAFVMSESSSSEVLHNLLRSKDVHLYSFKQANGYSRKIDFLNVLELPQGVIDFGQNIPPENIYLVGPMVELVARKDLHPAVIDLLLEAAAQVHSHAGVFQKRGEFPMPVEHAIKMSDDATRFHQSGKNWLYRMFPFWLASVISRIMVAFLPTLVILIPALKSVPAFFRWKMQMKIHRHYKNLLSLEQKYLLESDAKKREALRHDFDRIEKAVNKMKVSAAFADQFYGLRGHIDYVRQLLTTKARESDSIFSNTASSQN